MELNKLTAHQLKDLITKKEVKVEEVTKAYIDRVKSIDDKIGAFLYLAEEEAIQHSKLLDEKISKNENLNALSGIPIGIKDN
ncbi:MAG: gatA, partial [Clostridiaceae bacterium]|nr:gatA [Clostridiaceae bacterium]